MVTERYIEMDQGRVSLFLNLLYSLGLDRGTPYASFRMTELSSSFGGYHDVNSSCVSKIGTDRDRTRRCCVWRFLPRDESHAFSSEACRRQKLILDGRE